MKVRNHELTYDNLEEWGSGTLEKDKEALLSNNVDIKESLLLVRLINVELQRREIVNEVNDLSDYASKQIIEQEEQNC